MSPTVLEWGTSTALRECGLLLTSLRVRVVRCLAGSQAADADPNGVPDAHLDRRKDAVHLDRENDLVELVRSADLVITDGTFLLAGSEVLAAGVDIVAITPFGLAGPDAGTPGGDLVASHGGGYAHYLTWSVDDPDAEPPTRGPAGQCQLVAGLTAAVAAAARLVGRARGPHQPELVDVAEQEAVVTLLLPQLSERTEGTLKTGRHRARGGSKVAGGLVGLLPCADGHVIVSPREDHQWSRLMAILGDPAWGSAPEAATPALRMANWEELQVRLGEWTRRHGKESVFRQLQDARIPCFPVNQVADALALRQLEERGFWYETSSGVRGPGEPFRSRGASMTGGLIDEAVV